MAPSTASTETAAANATYPTDVTHLTFSLNNSSASGAYPIVTPTYILIAQNPKSRAATNAVKAWLEWCLQKPQQAEVSKLGYAPLPAKLIALDMAALNTVH